jgi:hypothetical protein
MIFFFYFDTFYPIEYELSLSPFLPFSFLLNSQAACDLPGIKNISGTLSWGKIQTE